MNSLKGLILCGGKSSRMKQDKTLVSFQGKPLIAYATNLFNELGIEYHLSINSDQVHLKEEHTSIVDEFQDKGPLGGIVSAMKQLETHLLVIPVDMPFLSQSLMKELIDTRDIQEMVRCFQLNGRLEPFPSIWKVNSTERLEQFISERQLSLQKCIAQLPHQLINSDDSALFRNMNSPQDLR